MSYTTTTVASRPGSMRARSQQSISLTPQQMRDSVPIRLDPANVASFKAVSSRAARADRKHYRRSQMQKTSRRPNLPLPVSVQTRLPQHTQYLQQNSSISAESPQLPHAPPLPSPQGLVPKLAFAGMSKRDMEKIDEFCDNIDNFRDEQRDQLHPPKKHMDFFWEMRRHLPEPLRLNPVYFSAALRRRRLQLPPLQRFRQRHPDRWHAVMEGSKSLRERAREFFVDGMNTNQQEAVCDWTHWIQCLKSQASPVYPDNYYKARLFRLLFCKKMNPKKYPLDGFTCRNAFEVFFKEITADPTLPDQWYFEIYDCPPPLLELEAINHLSRFFGISHQGAYDPDHLAYEADIHGY